jgi:C4-dicarboxylate transporter DctM subunit
MGLLGTCRGVLGSVMDCLSMILLTIPIFFPIVMGLDFGLSPEETAILVPHHRADHGRGWPDHAAGRHDQFDGRGRADAAELPRLDTFLASDIIRVVLLVALPWLSLFTVRLLY